MINSIYFFSIDVENKISFFDFHNAHSDLAEIAKSYNADKFDGIEWKLENQKYRINFKSESVYQVYFSSKEQRIFVLYEGISPTHPSPNNLVAYNSHGEIERILTPPILSSGKQGAGFFQINDFSSRLFLPKGHENNLEVVVWEHDISQHVFHYFLNPITLDFEFEKSSRL